MRVYLTGAAGFVGRWLTEELRGAGHTLAGGPDRVDVTDAAALAEAVRISAAEAVVHLAAVAYAPDAAAEPARAFEVNVGGTINLMEAIRSLPSAPVVLVAGSSEVYGAPRAEDVPLTEVAPLRPRTAYGVSKAAQEAVALAYAARLRLPVVVTRSFNHSGPGQRPVFVLPALASRVAAVRRGDADVLPVGNLDVRRDFLDVRDVVRAYRLLLEALASRRIEPGGSVFNVCSGEAVSIRRLLGELTDIAGVAPEIRIDPALVRPGDPPEIRGDASALRALTGWAPVVPRRRMLAEILAACDEPVRA